jgi:hypothetical protein
MYRVKAWATMAMIAPFVLVAAGDMQIAPVFALMEKQSAERKEDGG